MKNINILYEIYQQLFLGTSLIFYPRSFTLPAQPFANITIEGGSGFLMVIGFSFLTTFVISPYGELSLTPEILARMDSSFIYILMALLLGFASIFALSRNISESMAGVAIAAALLPPAAVTGISLVLYPSRAVNSLVLTLENVFGLMAGRLCATVFLDIRPRRYYERAVARKVIFRTAAVLIILLGLLCITSFYCN